MGINYLDGARFKKGCIAAAKRVLDAQERLNKINVFPIPDGDTGTNMALTLRSVANQAINTEGSDLSSVSRSMAEAALMQARGNSGSILAQFFQGFADAFETHGRVDMEGFATASRNAAASAERGIAKPVEGTMLTVIRDWADDIEKNWLRSEDFLDLLKTAHKAAVASLKGTPEKLPVLAKAGVVDAGGQGFVHMLEGAIAFIETGEMDYEPAPEDDLQAMPEQTIQSAQEITFRYCTECIIAGDAIQLAEVRERVESFGDSLIVAGNPRMVKVHIHTNEPKSFFKCAGAFGTVKNTKTEDMRAQFLQRTQSKTSDIALITDSSCDLPTDFMIGHKIRVVPAGVTVGHQSYLDRVSITSEEVYRLMNRGAPFPTTSQPAPAAFKKAYSAAADQHRQAVAIFLSSAVSGTYQAGVNMAKDVKGLNLRVIDSKTTTGSLGLLVREAAEAIAEGCDLNQVVSRVENARSRVRLFLMVKTLDHLIRGGRIGKVQGWLARMLGLVPILTLNTQGKVALVGKARRGKSSRQKLLALVRQESVGFRNLRFQICHAAAASSAEFFADRLKAEFHLEQVEILQMSPTMGAHVGPGTCAIAFLGEPRE